MRKNYWQGIIYCHAIRRVCGLDITFAEIHWIFPQYHWICISYIFFGGMGYILSKALDKGFFSFFGRTSVPDANLFCLLLVETQAIGISQVLRYRLSYDFHSQLRWRRHNTHTIWLFSPISGQCISRQKTYIVRFFCLSDIELPTGCLPSLIQGGNWSARFTVTIERLSKF